jgi:hypothetical protein
MTQLPLRFRVWDGERMWAPKSIEIFDTGEWAAYPGRDRLPMVSYGTGWKGLEHPIRMMATTLRDADGSEIFQGDIVDTGPDNMGKMVVRWDLSSASFILEGQNNRGTTPIRMRAPITTYCRVVGNIFENPDLVP